jgi:hypothetical protein
VGSEPLDDLSGALIFLVLVRLRQIELQLVGMDFGEEFAAAGEVFVIRELVLFEAVNGFHIALIGAQRGVCARAGCRPEPWEVPFELAAIDGLPDQIAQGNAATVQQLLDARSEDSAGLGAAFFGESPEQQPAANFAGPCIG